MVPSIPPYLNLKFGEKAQVTKKQISKYNKSVKKINSIGTKLKKLYTPLYKQTGKNIRLIKLLMSSYENTDKKFYCQLNKKLKEIKPAHILVKKKINKLIESRIAIKKSIFKTCDKLGHGSCCYYYPTENELEKFKLYVTEDGYISYCENCDQYIQLYTHGQDINKFYYDYYTKI
jgi:hypothetical protein